VTERVREKTSKTRGDYASAIREHCYVSQPIETKYSNFTFPLHIVFKF